MEKSLIVFYSWGGDTANIAATIKENTGADIFEIKLENPYPSAYHATTEQAKKEIKEVFRPTLIGDIDIAEYNRIYIGSPNWWSTIAPPVATFIESHDFTGKIIMPFFTHGGGGLSRMLDDTINLLSDIDVRAPYVAYSGDTSGIAAWINSTN